MADKMQNEDANPIIESRLETYPIRNTMNRQKNRVLYTTKLITNVYRPDLLVTLRNDRPGRWR